MKVKRKFKYKGIELKIVEREETYMNSPDTVTVKRVIAPNGGLIPVEIGRRQTLKSIIEETLKLLEVLDDKGYGVVNELTKER